MLRNQDEDQLKQILSETFTNTNYIDEEIQDLLISRSEEPSLKHAESVESHTSQRSSESSPNTYLRQQSSIGSNPDRQSLTQQIYPDKIVEKFMPQSEQSQHIFDEFYRAINRNLRAETIEQVRQKYPLFLLSQPHYQIKNQIKEITLNYSGGLLRKNILVIDAGYCEQQKVFKVAVGTDEGHVVIFEPNSSKPQQIIDCFSKISYITCVRWSKNLQYLAMTNDEKELKVYQFKQAINIESQISYRILKNPIQFCSLNEKQLKHLVIQLEFVTETPFQMILVTETEQILRLEMKKQFLSLKPHLTEFQYKFSDFLDVKILTTMDQNKNLVSFMAASGYQLVTLCLIEPRFQIAMVYDKQKHGGHIKKTGYPQVSFRENPTSMMVVWDKYLEIIDIQITSFNPPTYSFSISHRFLFPVSTILSGFLSNSLLYQVTGMGVNLYSTTTFETELPKKYEEKLVHFHGINYSNFCYGEKIEDAISHNQVQLSDLRYLRGLFEPKNRTLFISTNRGIEMIYVSTLQQYINSLIENSNWKAALQLLKDCYLGVVYQLDEIAPELILTKIKELSIRYINFLETIILNDIASNQTNILLLWNQELIFVFSIILKTDLQTFLLDSLIPKVYKLNPTYILNIVPFILTKQLNQITPESLEIFLETLPLEIISKLIFNLQPNNNEPELPHQINNLLIKHQLYLELIDLNQKFRDHYTPIAVLVGLYVRLELDNDRNIMEITEEKRGIAKLIAYSVFDTLSGINFNKYSKNQNKEIMTTVLPLLTEQIISILVRQQPTALFQNIFQELYMGTCLQTLNQLDLSNHEHDIMLNIVDSIDYCEVCRFGCQKKYWIAVLKLYARRIITLNIYQGLHYLCIEDYVEEEYMDRFVSKCYEQILQELSALSEDVLNTFFEALLRTNHICLVKMIGKVLRRYIDALQAMFRCQPQRNLKIYQYLQDCLPCLSSLQLQLLKPLLKHNIQLLTDIDANKASDIICKYYLADLNLFIDDLADYKHEQLKLIHAVLQLYCYKESLIGLKVKYLELLAITGNQDRILEELMKENYPLDQSLDICKRYDVLEAYAYLLVKSGATGHIQEAISVYFKLIWQKIVKIVLNALDPEPELEETIMHYAHQCIQICIELTTEDHQIEWFHIMEELQHLKKSIFKNLIIDMHTCELLKQIINKKTYPQLIRRMITQVQYSNIIHYLKIKLSSFDLEAIQIVVDQMKKSYIYQKKMQIVVQEMFVQTENQLRKRLFKKQLQGFATNDTCHFCGQKGGLLVHYHCGHEVHPSCGQDVRQCMICLEDMDAIFHKRIDTLLKTKVEIYSGGITGNVEEVEQQIQKENSLKKMQNYDEMLANARLIIDL